MHRVGPAAALGIQRLGTATGHRRLHDTQGANTLKPYETPMVTSGGVDGWFIHGLSHDLPSGYVKIAIENGHE